MNRHPTDVVSLVFGVAFTAVGTVYLLPGVGLRDVWDPRLWPLALVVLGVLLVVSTVRRGGASEQVRSAGTAQQGEAASVEDEPTVELAGAEGELHAEDPSFESPASGRPER